MLSAFPLLACVDVADAGYTENTWLQYTANVLKQQQPVLPSTPTSHHSSQPLYQLTPDKNLVQPSIKYESGNETPPPSAGNLANGGQEMRDHAMFVNANKWIVPKREMSSSPCPADNPIDVHSKFTLKVPTIPCHFQQNQTVANDASSPVAPTSKTPPGASTDHSLLRRALCAPNGTALLSEDTDGDRTPPHTPSSDSSPSSNICPECGKNLRYRSSFRRHMRLHQGVYSHVCAVCRRKFTRKEHFLRHKCNRRSYLPSRSADSEPIGETSLPSLVEKVICAEYPSSDTASPDKQNAPISVSDSSMEGESLEEQDIAEDLSKIPIAQVKQEPSVTNQLCRQAPAAESRRKRTIPRKVIPSLQEDNCQFVDDLSNEDDDDDDYFKLQICEQLPPPQLAEISPKHSGYEKFEISPKDSEYDKFIGSKVVKKLENCWEREDGKENKGQSILPASDKACDSDQLFTDFQSPNHPFRAMAKMSMASTNKISLDTGEYAVSCFDADKPGGGTNALNAFIKVVKQGNYLKLRKQAQMIGDQLCFVCPNCSKVFHRSSNFSRHMRIHRGVYSYVCPTCSRGFFRKEHFQKHKCYRRGMSHIWDRKTKIDMQIEKAGEPDPVLPPGELGKVPFPPGELAEMRHVHPPVLTRMLEDASVDTSYGVVEYAGPACMSPDMPCLEVNDNEGAIRERSQVVV